MGPIPPKGHETKNRRVKSLALLDKTAKVMELCRQRDPVLTFDQIAKQLGLSDRTVAFRDYQRGLRILREEIAESTEDARATMLARFDAMATGLMQSAEAGDVEAVKAMLAIDKQRAELQGLNAPKKVEADVDITMTKLADAAASVRAKILAKSEPKPPESA